MLETVNGDMEDTSNTKGGQFLISPLLFSEVTGRVNMPLKRAHIREMGHSV
jgi:hypothetical protein